MGFFKEFRDFAVKGNVLDLAIGVIIGAAFGKIVSSLVEDIITPLLLNPAMKAAKVENIKELSWNGVTYGNFLSAVISFLCVAFVLFILIKAINRVSKPKTNPVPPAPPAPSEDQKLLAEIRDLLKSKNI